MEGRPGSHRGVVAKVGSANDARRSPVRCLGFIVRLIPRDDSFFDLLTEQAQIVLEAAELLGGLVAVDSGRDPFAEKLRDIEKRGDELNEQIVRKLNTSFITPFDHEDIYLLATVLDDVVDDIDSAGDHIVLFELDTLPEGVHDQVDSIRRAAHLTADAMTRLKGMKDLASYWEEMGRIESDADRVYRRLLARLFSGEYKALMVMKLREVVDELESAMNAFERVAKCIESIAVKES